MKKLFAAILSLVLVLSLSTAFAGEKLSVIATENPHAEILELVKDDLAALGYDLDLTIATDYVIENPATAAGDVMANFFQHLPYLAQYNGSVSEAEQLVPVIYTHFEPMAIYAGTKSSLDDIADGDKIAIPNDPVNENRAFAGRGPDQAARGHHAGKHLHSSGCGGEHQESGAGGAERRADHRRALRRGLRGHQR